MKIVKFVIGMSLNLLCALIFIYAFCMFLGGLMEVINYVRIPKEALNLEVVHAEISAVVKMVVFTPLLLCVAACFYKVANFIGSKS